MTAEDLASYSAEWVQPISIDYRGWRVYELPPNGQGMAALEMLNIMETAPPTPLGAFSPIEMHKRIEAMKLAYADVHRYDADPHTYDIPVAQLLSKEYARKRAALIDPKHANCEVPAGQPVGSDTTYLTIVDKDGNMTSWIQSVYSDFGSGVTVEGMGFLLQNRGGGFTLEPKHPNVLVGGKRPFHTIIPAFMERGDMHIGFGIMGGANQPLAHAQFVSNLVDYDMNLQAALEAPRFTKTQLHRLRPVDRSARSRGDACSNFPNAATRSPSAASTRKKWAAARRSYTTRRPEPTTPPPTPAPTAPRFRSRFVLS